MKNLLIPLLVPLLMMVSCTQEPADSEGNSQFTFNMPLSFAKTQAGIQIDSVHVTITGPTNVNGILTISSDSATASGTFTGLIAGNYSISILAFANHDTVAKGSGNATVTPGQITDVNLTLTLLTGGLNINVHWAAVDPNVFGYVTSLNGHEYYLSLVKMTWVQADSACQASGGHLVTITSATENDTVLSISNRSSEGHQWIGFNDIALEGTWVWVTGETVTYTNWQSGEPNDQGGEDGGVFRRDQNKWWDAETNGATTFYFILELE